MLYSTVALFASINARNMWSIWNERITGKMNLLYLSRQLIEKIGYYPGHFYPYIIHFYHILTLYILLLLCHFNLGYEHPEGVVIQCVIIC
jgi:hypothetical protein